MAAHAPNPAAVMYLDELKVDVPATIVVMLCRMWDVNAVGGRFLSTDFMLSDAKGNAIHCTARSTVSHGFYRLKEGTIYSVKNFKVIMNKDEYRVRKNDAHMLEFDGETTFRKAAVKPDGFIRHPLQLVDIHNIELTANKYLIDVAGYVTNVGRLNHTRHGTKNLDFYIANQRGQTMRVTLWGGLGDSLIEKKIKRVGMCAIVVTAVSAKYYNNKLYLSSTSSTQLLDSPEIPALIELTSAMSEVMLSKPRLRDNPSEPKEGTIENLLIWARSRKDEPAVFNCKSTITTVRTKKGWCYPSCGSEKCKKGATRKEGRWWCDSCDMPIPYPVMRYRLELGISDEPADTVVVLFDDPATALVKCSAESIVSMEDECNTDHVNLPPALANLIGTTHVFEIRSQTYYEYGKFESFTCWNVDPPVAVESACSSSAPTETLTPQRKNKKLVKAASIPTPSKPTEGVHTKRLEYEDSDAEVISAVAEGGDEGTIEDLSGNKRKKGLSINTSDADDDFVDETLPVAAVKSASSDKKKKRQFIVEDSE